MLQEPHPDTVPYRDDAVTASQLKFKAIRIQISAERPGRLREEIEWILSELEDEGPQPVYDTLAAYHGDPLNGNTTINRRLRALAAHRKGESDA